MTVDEKPGAPPLAVRWMRPQAATVYLELPVAPVAASASKDVTWQAFTAAESEACEATWQSMSDEERRLAESEDVDGDLPKGGVEDPDEEEDKVGVTIAKDKLFEIDVASLTLRPIYWKMNAPPIRVMRATWMFDEHRPVPRDLADKLERHYKRVKPWQHSYSLELMQALEQGPEAHAKLKESLDDNQSIIFEDEFSAYIVSNATATTRFFSFYPSRTVANSRAHTTTYYPTHTIVYRGYDAAVSATQAKELARSTSRSRSSSLPPSALKRELRSPKEEPIAVSPEQEDFDVKRRDSIAIRGRKRSEGRHSHSPSLGGGLIEDEGEITDLILIIHGIGQGLAAQYEGFNFVYAANLFRQICKKQSTTPALASVMRGQRVQFLPVQWRANLKLDVEEEERRGANGFDNNFSLSDITIKNSVPYVRDLMNNVLIDIPYFMSHHRDQMVEVVTKQANRIYKLWCARNPGFEERGRVHIIGHSLGSSLAGHILSNQPTIQPTLSSMSEELIKNIGPQFLFNTSLFFMVGSPLALFVHIHRTQVIARKGRERTMCSPPDEAFDRAGIFGCLSVDSIYNIFNPADPIAYLMNPCVDSGRAKDLPPSVIRNTSTALLTSFSSRVTKIFEGIATPFHSSSPRSDSSSRPMSPAGGSGFELGGPSDTVVGTKEERRFLALNPRGTLDFVLPSEGNLSDYLDMITAHSSYWNDPNLAAFILAEIFARKEDFVRTGLGVESPGLDEPI